jgi:uncharacterized protein (TIGR01777 family)
VDVAITGSHGLIGTALGVRLERDGHRVLRLVRDGSGTGVARSGDVARWDPERGAIDRDALEGIDAVVHLAGVGIGDKKWTPERKRQILESRTRGTTLLSETLAALSRKPGVLVSASAVGYYGSRGDERLTEDSPPGDDFVAGVVVQWEAATEAATAAGIRVVRTRSGIVLARHGGALGRMLLPFRLGLGGRVASGRQYMSWIALDDEVRAILHAITTDSLEGPVNLTAPNPVRNADFAKTLGKVLRRPTVLPTPLLPLKLVYSEELVRHLLVEGQRVLPTKLEASGYEFAHPELEGALRSVLGKPLPAG